MSFKEELHAAHAMVHLLCHGDRKWTMSVPARPDHDPDLVIIAGLSAAENEITRLAAEVERLREALKREAEFRCRKCMRKQSLENIRSLVGERIWVHRSGEHTTVCSASHIHEALTAQQEEKT